MRNQRGSTLIAVLIVLLIITVLGVIAIRQGLTSLTLSTNAQVQALLTQSSDVVFDKIQDDYQTNSSVSNVMSFVTLEGNQGKEWIACYRPTTSNIFYNILTNTTAVVPSVAAGDNTVGVEGGDQGFCDITKDFSSNRNAVITQVAIMIPNDPVEDARPFEYAPRKTDVSNSKIESTKRVRVYSTSIVPSMTTANLTTVQDTCLRNRVSDDMDRVNSAKETITDCLARLGVPANTQVQEYQLTTVISQAAITN